MKTDHHDARISGIHHITAITSSAMENVLFYEEVLGLRLVKQTVNFDDPYTYHLYYGDDSGTPGTILTFFPWERLPAGRPGTGMVSAVAFSIPENSVHFWIERLNDQKTEVQRHSRFGQPVLTFVDPHGLILELVGTADTPETTAWRNSSVPGKHAIAGFHSATMVLSHLDNTRPLLTEIMGMSAAGSENGRTRFTMYDQSAPGHILDVIADPDVPPAQSGSGTVHHIAFRTENSETQVLWQNMLRRSGIPVTEVRDRKYFQSIYFHEPGGVLFEIATDPPGFAIDEDIRQLGEHLQLPDQYEPMRTAIQKRLPPLRIPEFQHVYVPAESGEKVAETWVTLHGSGGTEQDLIRLAQRIREGTPIISPRGKAPENGMSRYFRRLTDNVFDEEDVIFRAHELADFLIGAAYRYRRQPEHLIALGYSNGANIAAALLLRPEIFSRAILFRPMMPLQHVDLPNLNRKNILVLRGKYDTVIPAESTERLIEALKDAGADIEVETINSGHELTREDINLAYKWMAHGEQTIQTESLVQSTS